ncbi:unnamed protein product [Kluyveromyces dobzhanskii CBS 2104]|uniref:WGS project CCBQ000000000 data, contig 00058 n=1 Tax=Kluyveromyces dobzhanskii CBS 2104 TaxID=1427455 RepID=A0A0A8LB96_9SACH|nr:unnamed protein product [Kluyveromyces dobzhanskii CBS 2104]
MAIRHFRKQAERPSGSESSSSDEEAATEKRTDLTEVTTTLEEESAAHSTSKETSDSESDSGSSSSSSSSSSNDEVTLHKPVFLKRKKVAHLQEQEQEKNGSSIRAAHLTKVLQEKQAAQRAQDSETTDQSILTQVMSTDDTDSINPELELLLWEQRQQARLQREREKKLQKQSQIEEQEMQRAAQLDLKDDPLLKQPESQTASASNRLNAMQSKTAPRNTSKPRTDSAVPTRLNKNDTKLASLHTSNPTEDTEYAYMEE